jgi:predicted enzyme related to lactoylglutathione lyase
MIKKIATAAVYVDDQPQAVDFWTKQVGFTVHREQPMGPHASWIELGPEAAESCLVLYPKSMMEDWAQRKPSIVFESDDIEKTYVQMRERGVQFTQPPKEMPWGPFAIFVDPEGNWFGLRGRVADR